MSQLRQRVEALPPGSWGVVDEVQRLPSLLNEVHELTTRHGKRYRYALSGSSPRKLRRADVNLLAGRGSSGSSSRWRRRSSVPSSR